MKHIKDRLIAGLVIALLSLPFLLFSEKCNGQKIFNKTKDPFSGIIQISTYPINIAEVSGKVPVFQFTGVKIIDTTVKYLFNISNSYLDIISSNYDTTGRKCLLKMDNGVFVEGKFGGTVIVPIMDKKMISTGFYFEEYQAKELAQHAVVAVLFKGDNGHEGTFDIEKKLQYNIAGICKLLLKQ